MRIATSLVLAFCLWGPQGICGTPQTTKAAAKTPNPDGALTNSDIIKLSKLDLGSEIIIAKINQSKKFDFKLDTDSLVHLKQSGVSKDVIAAMLKKTTPPESPAVPAASPTTTTVVPVMPPTPGDEGVLLLAGGKELKMHSVLGDLSTTWAYVTTLMFLDFPGLKADLQTTEPTPKILIKSKKSPRGRVFFVKCESNKKDENRSVKLGRAGVFSNKSWGSPDKDWTIDFESKEITDGIWEITPKKPLEEGEYGLLFKGGFMGMLEPTRGELFDFGVKKN